MESLAKGSWAVRVSLKPTKVKAELYNFESGKASVLIDRNFGPTYAPNGPSFTIADVKADYLLSPPATKPCTDMPWLILGPETVRIAGSTEFLRLSSLYDFTKNGHAHSSVCGLTPTPPVLPRSKSEMHQMQSVSASVSTEDEKGPPLPPRRYPASGSRTITHGNQRPSSVPTGPLSLPARTPSALSSNIPVSYGNGMARHENYGVRQGVPQARENDMNTLPRKPVQMEHQTPCRVSKQPAAVYQPIPHPDAMQAMPPSYGEHSNQLYAHDGIGHMRQRPPPPPSTVSSPAILAHEAGRRDAQRYHPGPPPYRCNELAQNPQRPWLPSPTTPIVEGLPNEPGQKPGRVRRMMRSPGAKIAIRLGTGLLVGGALGSQIGNISDQWADGKPMTEGAIASASSIGGLAHGFSEEDNDDDDVTSGGYVGDGFLAGDQTSINDQGSFDNGGVVDNESFYADSLHSHTGEGCSSDQPAFEPYSAANDDASYPLDPWMTLPNDSDRLAEYDISADNGYQYMYGDQNPGLLDPSTYYSTPYTNPDYNESNSYENFAGDNDVQLSNSLDADYCESSNYGGATEQETGANGTANFTTADNVNSATTCNTSSNTDADEMSAMMSATALNVAMAPSTLNATI